MVSFKTRKECEAFLSATFDRSCDYANRPGTFWYSSGMYQLSHGEYDRPTYEPRRYKDGWGVRVEYSYLPGTYNAPQSGRWDSHDDLGNYWYSRSSGSDGA